MSDSSTIDDLPSPGDSAATQVYRALIEMISRKELVAGSVLQERKLAEALGVSRTPLREALNRLAGSGLLVRQPSGVLTIRPFDIQDYIEILHVRRILEGETAALAATRGVDPGAIERVRRQITDLISNAAPSARDHWAVDDAVHELTATAGGSKLLAKLIRDLRQRTRIFDVKRLPERFLPGCQEHLAILDALATGDAEAARRMMTTHIENVKASILRDLSRL
jgi:DNA-binding GntR family transcriptional regulator